MYCCSLFLQQNDRSASEKIGTQLPVMSQHPSPWSGVNSSSYTSYEVLIYYILIMSFFFFGFEKIYFLSLVLV